MFDLIMNKCLLFRISCVITSRAGHVCVPTDLGTSGCLRLMLNFIVSKRFYNDLRREDFFAYRAMRAFRETRFGASRSNRYVNNLRMRGRNFLRLQNGLTDRTFHMLGTVRRTSFLQIYDPFTFGVFNHGNNRLFYKNFITYRAMRSFCETCFCTSRLDGSVRNLTVSKCGNRFCFHRITAVTNEMLFACFGACRLRYGNPCHADAVMRFGFRGSRSASAVATSRTYAIDIVMPERRNDGLRLVHIATARYGAHPAPCQTRLRTSGLSSLQNFHAVMFSADNRADGLLISASFTFHVEVMRICDLRTVIGRF